MLLPRQDADRRHLADSGSFTRGDFSVSPSCDRIKLARGRADKTRPCVDRNHTPSPFGQHADNLAMLSDFLPVRCLHFITAFASRQELSHALGVGANNKSSTGTTKCPSRKSFWPLRPAAALPHAVTHCPNRHLAVRLSVPAPRRSPAAIWSQVRLSAPPAASPIVSFTPTSAADCAPFQTQCNLIRPRAARFSIARRADRPILFQPPAQALLQRDFCVSYKPRKDIPCSTKS